MRNNKKKKLIVGALALAVLAGPVVSGQAAEKSKKNAQLPADLPIVIQSDKIYFNDTTGDFRANGNVAIEQGQQILLSELVRGNSKQSMVWLDEKATFLQPGTQIVGNTASYDYKNKTGTINQAKGKVEKEFVSGQTIDLASEKVVIHNGTVTRCPAIVPDYHLSAERVEVLPGDKMVAYNVKFWIKETIVLSLPKYQMSLKKKKENSFLPRIGYDSDDGAFIKQSIGFPINNTVGFYSDLTYYSDAGFKPQYRIEAAEKNYTFGVDYGNYRDDDGNWLKKEPEFNLSLGNRIGSSPISYSLTAQYGKWTDDVKSSWHQDYKLYFSHDQIELGKGLSFNVGAGVEYLAESYDSSSATKFRYDLGLTKTISPKFDIWTQYHHVTNNTSLFNFDKVDVNRELVPGITYRPDRLNTFTFYQSYDINNHSVFERYYVWNRNLHCLETTIEYKEKEKKLSVSLQTATW